MNNEKNVGFKICFANRPRSKARAVTMDLYSAMLRNEVELHEVMNVLSEAVTGFLVPISRNLGFEKREILKSFGDSLMAAEV